MIHLFSARSLEISGDQWQRPGAQAAVTLSVRVGRDVHDVTLAAGSSGAQLRRLLLQRGLIPAFRGEGFGFKYVSHETYDVWDHNQRFYSNMTLWVDWPSVDVVTVQVIGKDNAKFVKIVDKESDVSKLYDELDPVGGSWPLRLRNFLFRENSDVSYTYLKRDSGHHVETLLADWDKVFIVSDYVYGSAYTEHGVPQGFTFPVYYNGSVVGETGAAEKETALCVKLRVQMQFGVPAARVKVRQSRKRQSRNRGPSVAAYGRLPTWKTGCFDREVPDGQKANMYQNWCVEIV